MAADTNQKRLDRIEEKIDKLSDAMISLARAEEKLIAIENNHNNHFERMNKFSQKLDAIEKKVDDNARTVQIINSIVYLVAVATVGVVIDYFWLSQ
jgi:tetrahydromethanopterin S-methyltransferase subunit G